MNHPLELTSWAQFKAICITEKGLDCQYTEGADRYDLFGPDANNLTWHTVILKNGGAEQVEFDATYKALFNKKILDRSMQLDSDGAPMSRLKVAPSGWNFNLRMFEVRLSTIGSLINKTVTGADAGDVVMSLYNAAGVIITDANTALATDSTGCVKTVIDLEPPYDIYVAGGNMRAVSQPTDDILASVIGVPDIPAAYGGSKAFVQSINMKYIPIAQGVNADGRAAKWLQYSATYHTNKIRFQFTHPAGYQLWIGIMMETYKQ